MGSNKYEKMFIELCEKYNLVYKETSDSTEIHNVLMDLFKTRCAGKKVALWGAGRKNTENSHAAIILKKYTTYIQGISCIIDTLPELWGDDFLGYPIISPDDIVKNDIDMVIIASKVQADSIVSDLKKHAPKCEYIDIYGELLDRGFKIYNKFYEESNIYTSIYKLKELYKETNDASSLRNLISAYLSINDFYYANKFGKYFIENKYEGCEEIKEFFEKLSELQDEVKKKNAKKKDDIVVYFIDSLRAMDVFHKNESGEYEADMLQKYLEKATVFTKAKSTGVTTYESMISVVKQKYPYEQNVYENNILSDFGEFKLLPEVKKQGYKMRFYVSEGYQIIHDTDEVEFIKQVYLPAKLWKLATDMAATDDKTFNFIYFPYELHFPLVCGYHEKEPKISGFVDVGVVDTSEFVPRQIEECKDYVDKLFTYYEDYFSDEILMTLFSDHSQVVFDEDEKKPYFMYYANQDRCVNITWFIKGFGIEQNWNEELISLYDFTDVMMSVIKNRKLEIPNRKIAKYQYYKIHYNKLREYAWANGLEKYIDGMQCFTNKEYVYIITAHGDEEVYKLDDIKKNIISEKEGREFAMFVKENEEIEFPKFLE